MMVYLAVLLIFPAKHQNLGIH